MKIIHVTHCYHPSKGGVQWFFKNVSERLVKDYGDEVTVVTTNSMWGPERLKFEKIRPASEEINGVKVLRFAYIRWHIKPLRMFIKAMHKLSIKVPESLVAKLYGPLSAGMKQFLMQTDADAICASSSNYYYMQLPVWKACNFFYFGSIHLNDHQKQPVLTAVQKKSIKASKLYIANTIFEKQQLVEAGIQASKINVIGVGVDEQSFNVDPDKLQVYRKGLLADSDSIVVGYVGRIEATKSVKILLDAFIKLSARQPKLVLLIAGSGGDYANELKAYAGQLPASLNKRIIWKLDFELHEKPYIFHALDMLVLPSTNESFGIVFLEAWVCKKPVIGANIGAVRSVISNEEDGLLMNVNDIESLCDKIEILSNNATLRQQMGLKGHQKVLENYTWDIITAKLRQCYMVNMENNHVNGMMN